MYCFFRSFEESILVKKAAYRSLGLPMTVSVPKKLVIMLLAREGNTRQILNQKEFVEGVRTSLGNQVRRMGW